MKTRLALASLLVAAACGGDDGPPNNPPPTPDAPPETPTCAAATTSISSYPGTAMGTVVGAGADLTAAEMACADEQSDWYEPTGEDAVIALSGLTVGQRYGVIMSSEDDLGIYVTSSCPTTGAVQGCLVYADGEGGGSAETAYFTATGTEHYLIVDDGEFGALTSGSYDVQVVNAQCTIDSEMTDCQAASPFCVDFSCVQCLSSFDCQAGSPVCGSDNACIAGPMQCTGDDARDAGAGDDGPAVATMLAYPTANAPTVISDGKICNTPGGLQEGDWYKVMVPANGSLGVDLTFTGAANDIDVYILNAAGQVQARGERNAGINEAIRADDLDAGLYYVLVLQYLPNNTTAAVPYTLTLSLPECDPAAFNSCPTAAESVCGPSGQCGVGPTLCQGDDAGDPNDDGPGGARTLTDNTPLTGAICTQPASELDHYRFTVTNGQGATITLDWTGTADLDAYVVDSTGKLYGQSFYVQPEVVTLTNLPAGTYYVRVENFLPQGGTPSTTSQAYTITADITPVTQCTNATSCASEYKTQIFRGSCNPTTDVCSFLPAGTGANNTLCDSGDDCQSMRCSYQPFERDAQNSVCIPTSCTTDAQCTAIDADLRCTTGYTSGGQAANFCHHACTGNLDCGANVGSATLDAGEPWNYRTCAPATGVCSNP